MTTLAQFDSFTLRHADQLSDLEHLSAWIDADETHRGIYEPNFFLTGVIGKAMGADPRPSCYALEDENGVLFYIRLSRASRVHIQFAPEGDRRQKARVAKGLFHGMAFLEDQLGRAGCEQWIFDTASPSLKALTEKLLGFTESTHEMVRAIANPPQGKEDDDVRRAISSAE